MALPGLLENGFLPPGLYVADMSEIEERLGTSTERRKELFKRLQNFVELAKQCGALRILVNGSFVAAKSEPGDIDVAIWLGTKYLELLQATGANALLLEEMFDSRDPKEAFLVNDERGWNRWVDFFSRVREYPNKRKGLVEVQLP